MGTNPFGVQRRYGRGGLLDGPSDQRVHAIARERLAADVEEGRRFIRVVEARTEQPAQGLGGVRPQRTDTDFASLAMEALGR